MSFISVMCLAPALGNIWSIDHRRPKLKPPQCHPQHPAPPPFFFFGGGVALRTPYGTYGKVCSMLPEGQSTIYCSLAWILIFYAFSRTAKFSKWILKIRTPYDAYEKVCSVLPEGHFATYCSLSSDFLCILTQSGVFQTKFLASLKGNPRGKCKLAWKRRNAQFVSFAGFCGFSVNIFCNRCTFCFEIENFKAQPCCLVLYRWRAEKGLAHDVIGTCDTHSGLVHDVKDTDYRAHDGSAHGGVFATFKRRFFMNQSSP